MAGDLRGRVTPGSGSGWITKNDVLSEKWSVECKYTDKKSYSLRGDVLLTAERNALLDNRLMALVIDIQQRSWVVISYADFTALIEET